MKEKESISDKTPERNIYKLEELTPRLLDHKIETIPVVIVPSGSIEWHGYHNPIGLDTMEFSGGKGPIHANSHQCIGK